MMLYPKKKVIKALQKGVKKWSYIYHGYRPLIKECSLCDMFLLLNDCRLCPVMRKTGLQRCKGTPYTDWANHQKKEHSKYIGSTMEARCEHCTYLAGKQFLFLLKLLKDQR